MRHAFFFSRQRSQEIFESEHAVLLSVAIYVEVTLGIDEEDLCDLRFQGQTIVEFAKHFQMSPLVHAIGVVDSIPSGRGPRNLRQGVPTTNVLTFALNTEKISMENRLEFAAADLFTQNVLDAPQSVSQRLRSRLR